MILYMVYINIQRQPLYFCDSEEQTISLLGFI